MKVPICCILLACAVAGCAQQSPPPVTEPYPSEIRERHRPVTAPQREDGPKADQRIRDIQDQVRDLKDRLPQPRESGR